jgi:hypothetical protein
MGNYWQIEIDDVLRDLLLHHPASWESAGAAKDLLLEKVGVPNSNHAASADPVCSGQVAVMCVEVRSSSG